MKVLSSLKHKPPKSLRHKAKQQQAKKSDLKWFHFNGLHHLHAMHTRTYAE
jgi:hypothetical protein